MSTLSRGAFDAYHARLRVAPALYFSPGITQLPDGHTSAFNLTTYADPFLILFHQETIRIAVKREERALRRRGDRAPLWLALPAQILAFIAWLGLVAVLGLGALFLGPICLAGLGIRALSRVFSRWPPC